MQKRAIIYLLSLLLLLGFNSMGQRDTCTFYIEGTDTSLPVFLASNMNQWNPADINCRFEPHTAGQQLLTLVFDKGTELKYKCTRGSWDKVECTSDGKDIQDHKLRTDTSRYIHLKIGGWKLPENPQTMTVPSHVLLLENTQILKSLKKKRKIWVYLPPGYENKKKRYPVLYMQDGQNLFDARTSFAGEWGVDETMDSLIANGVAPCIVVGIENGGKERMNEYNPFDFVLHPGSPDSVEYKTKADIYLNAIVQELKPYIDRHYRTLAGAENCMIAGSSMGAVVSYYAVLTYPKVFGKAGVLSPAFWTAPKLNALTDSLGAGFTGKVYFYIGQKEGKGEVKKMEQIIERLSKTSECMISVNIDPEGRHNEAAWRQWFGEFYKWVMAEGFNMIME